MRNKIIISGVFLLLAVVFFAGLVRFDIPVEKLKDKYADENSRFIEIDGMQVHYRDQGTGTPLVLIHGTAASLHTWDGWTEVLSGNFRVIRMDIPAFGLTGPFPDGDYTIGAYVEFLKKFLDAVGVESCHVAGSSLGGFIAWNYALEYPEDVKSLILLNSAGYPRSSIPRIFRIVRLPGAGFIGRYAGPRFLIERNVKEVYGDESKITPETVDRYHKLSLREGNRRAFIDRAGTQEDYETLSRRIPEIRVPTLIIWGTEDLWVPIENAYRFEKDIPDSRLVAYEGVGHIPMEEIPELSASDALDFLLGL